jgi:glycosyltransferase involved in cell wall biosynthesis
VRILYHHRTLADGAEGIHITEMMNAFKDLGHETRVQGLAPDNRYDGGRGWLSRVRDRIPHLVIEIASVAYNVVDFVKMWRAITRFRPDLLYKRHSRFDFAPLLVARRRSVPAVLEVNVVYSAKPYSEFEPIALHRLAERLERHAFELATLVIAVSTPLAHQIRALAPQAAVEVLPNGANPQSFDPRRINAANVRARLGLADHLVIGWMGIVREWHGLGRLLEALTMVPDAWLLIVGDGPDRPAMERRAEALGVRGRVVVTGRVPHASVPEYLAAMDIAVIADERTAVASPMKLLEYMAMGRPVVAPSMENVMDVVHHGVNGLLFTPGSAADLGKMLRQLADDPVLRGELGASARITVERERNWRRNAEVVLRLVRGAKGATSPGALRSESGRSGHGASW